jgi:hypothetical protein
MQSFYALAQAKSKLARSIWLRCAADLPIQYMGLKEPTLLSSNKIFFILLAASSVEMLEEIF